MGRVRSRRALRERLAAVPAIQRARWERNRLIVCERLARLTGGPRQLGDAALAALMVERRAEDDAALATRAAGRGSSGPPNAA